MMNVSTRDYLGQVRTEMKAVIAKEYNHDLKLAKANKAELFEKVADECCKYETGAIDDYKKDVNGNKTLLNIAFNGNYEWLGRLWYNDEFDVMNAEIIKASMEIVFKDLCYEADETENNIILDDREINMIVDAQIKMIGYQFKVVHKSIVRIPVREFNWETRQRLYTGVCCNGACIDHWTHTSGEYEWENNTDFTKAKVWYIREDKER